MFRGSCWFRLFCSITHCALLRISGMIYYKYASHNGKEHGADCVMRNKSDTYVMFFAKYRTG